MSGLQTNPQGDFFEVVVNKEWRFALNPSDEMKQCSDESWISGGNAFVYYRNIFVANVTKEGVAFVSDTVGEPDFRRALTEFLAGE